MRSRAQIARVRSIRVAASTSEEMDGIDPEGDELRPSGERPRARSSGPVARREPSSEAFDDVTPTRSLAEVGLADMDEDLPTRMQTLDELARFRSAAASEPSPPETSLPRRDVLRPPASAAPARTREGQPEAASPAAYRSFPPPRGRNSAPSSIPPADVSPPAHASSAHAGSVDAISPVGLVATSATPEIDEPSVAADEDASATDDHRSDRFTRVLVAISFALIVLAVAALVIERLVP
jgi:hypothetical protein